MFDQFLVLERSARTLDLHAGRYVVGGLLIHFVTDNECIKRV